MSPTVKSASLVDVCAMGVCAMVIAQRVNRATEARTARAFMLHSQITFFRAQCAPLVLSGVQLTELARDVVEQCDAHQQDEQRNTNLLSERLCPLRKRASFQPFNELKDDLPTVEDRDGQQVEEAERQRYQHQEAHERGDPRLGRV